MFQFIQKRHMHRKFCKNVYFKIKSNWEEFYCFLVPNKFYANSYYIKYDGDSVSIHSVFFNILLRCLRRSLLV
jgi:hypothetical protein